MVLVDHQMLHIEQTISFSLGRMVKILETQRTIDPLPYLAKEKNASSTQMLDLALVSKNLIPNSSASA